MLVGAFNQEKALVGAFSVIVKTGCGTDGSFYNTNNESLLMMIKCCTFISKTFLLLNIYTFVGFWSNESSKGYFHWKIEGQRKLPIASEASVDILRGLSLYNISESELHHWKFIQFICSVQKYSENWCQYKKLSFVARTFKFPGNIC